MRIYLDSSALVKRVVDDVESDALRLALQKAVAEGAGPVTSALARVEVSRTVRTRLDDTPLRDVATAVRDAFAGVAVAALTEAIVESARVVGPSTLRTTEAIHMATVMALGADEIWTYDDRMTQAAEELGIHTVSPA